MTSKANARYITQRLISVGGNAEKNKKLLITIHLIHTT